MPCKSREISTKTGSKRIGEFFRWQTWRFCPCQSDMWHTRSTKCIGRKWNLPQFGARISEPISYWVMMLSTKWDCKKATNTSKRARWTNGMASAWWRSWRFCAGASRRVSHPSQKRELRGNCVKREYPGNFIRNKGARTATNVACWWAGGLMIHLLWNRLIKHLHTVSDSVKMRI